MIEFMKDIKENSITLTESAAAHIQSELDKQSQKGEQMAGLRLGIKTSGCSGYAYVLDLVKAKDNLDVNNKFHIFKSHNIAIYVDDDSYKFIAGTEIDYVQQGISKVMMFHNPNVVAECGCGESFTVDQNKAQ
jgi:iron-sulfur cluster assembly protein